MEAKPKRQDGQRQIPRAKRFPKRLKLNNWTLNPYAPTKWCLGFKSFNLFGFSRSWCLCHILCSLCLLRCLVLSFDLLIHHHGRGRFSPRDGCLRYQLHWNVFVARCAISKLLLLQITDLLCLTLRVWGVKCQRDYHQNWTCTQGPKNARRHQMLKLTWTLWSL